MLSPVHSKNPFVCDILALTEGETWAQDGLPRSVSSAGHKAKPELWDLKKPLDFPPYPWNLTTHPSESEKQRAVCGWWGLSEAPRKQNGIDSKTETEGHGFLKAKVFCLKKKKKKIYIYIYIYKIGLFSSCREQGLLLVSVLRPFIVVASLVAEHSP